MKYNIKDSIIAEAVKTSINKLLTPSGQVDMFGNPISQACIDDEKKKASQAKKSLKPRKSDIEIDIDNAKKKAKKEAEGYKKLEKKGYKQVPMFTDECISEALHKTLNNIITEAKNLKSQKLYDILQAHGGFNKYSTGNFSNLTDEDIIGVFSYQDIDNMYKNGRTIDHWRWAENDGLDVYAKSQNIKLNPTDEVSSEKLADGQYLLYIDRNAKFDRRPTQDTNDGWKKYWEKKEVRRKNRYGDGKNEYQPMTDKAKAAKDIRQNPYFWAGKNGTLRDKDSGWTNPQERQRVMNNIRTGNVKNGRAY